FEAFFIRYEPQITGYLWRMLCNEEAALDASQETFFRAWQHFETLQAHPAPRAWLYRVATNIALQALRRQSSPVARAAAFSEENDPSASDPGRRWAEQDFVRQILLELPPKQRALLVLREVYNQSFQEIGELLGMSAETTRVAVSRAREQFRQS